jgi:hypothetical protein
MRPTVRTQSKLDEKEAQKSIGGNGVCVGLWTGGLQGKPPLVPPVRNVFLAESAQGVRTRIGSPVFPLVMTVNTGLPSSRRMKPTCQIPTLRSSYTHHFHDNRTS